MIVYTRAVRQGGGRSPSPVGRGSSPRQPVEKGLHDVADRFVAVLRRRWLSIVSSVSGGLSLKGLADLLARGDPDPVGSLGAAERMEAQVRRAVTDVAEEIIRREGATVAGRFDLSFNLTNPHAVDAVNTVVRDALAGIRNADRTAVRDAIRQGFLEGRTPQQTARAIRGLIGLTGRQADTLARFRGSLEEQGMPRARIEALVERMRRRQLRFRAETIARTETIRASAAGQAAAWEQAREAGLLAPGSLLRRDFATPDGVTVPYPPAHPRCRCALALKRRPDGTSVIVWVVTPDDRLCPICRAIPGLNPMPGVN